MPRSVWYCDLCGAEHSSEPLALGCEKGHTHVTQILTERYDGYSDYHEPCSITVKTTDGKLVTYRREEDI